MPKKQKKDITLDGLAAMVKYGFDGVDKRFDAVDKRLDGIDKRLDGIDKRLDKIEGELDNIKHLILSEHKRRIQGLEQEVYKIKELFAMH